MHNEVNPYRAPAEEPRSTGQPLHVARGQISKRHIAGLLAAAPFLLALPVMYWVFNIADDWLVSTGPEVNRREGKLGLTYTALMISITVVFMYFAFLLLWIDRWRPVLAGILTVFFGLLFGPALIYIGIIVWCYFLFG